MAWTCDECGYTQDDRWPATECPASARGVDCTGRAVWSYPAGFDRHKAAGRAMHAVAPQYCNRPDGPCTTLGYCPNDPACND